LLAKQKIDRNARLLKTSLLADAKININTTLAGLTKTSEHTKDLNDFYLFKKEHNHAHNDKQVESQKLSDDG